MSYFWVANFRHYNDSTVNDDRRFQKMVHHRRVAILVAFH
jgi:hypothetical protein